MDKLSAHNKERIRNWISENIHMVWDQVAKLQQPALKGFVLRVSFYQSSFPIVMQWKQSTDEFLIQEDVWYIDPDFSSINSFSDWVRNVKLTK